MQTDGSRQYFAIARLMSNEIKTDIRNFENN
jgi:hypothetical protein